MKPLLPSQRCRAALLGLGLLASTPAVVSAAAAGMNEAYVFVTWFTAPELTVKNLTIDGVGTHDAVMQMEDSELWGFGMSFGINDKLAISGDLAYGTVDYKATWGPAELRGEGAMWELRLAGDYTLLPDRPFSPYVSAGIGYSSFDSGIPEGPPQVICWWDPWWGNVCTGVVNTHHAQEFTWHAGAGLRWNATEAMVLKLSANLTWMSVGASGTEAFPEYRLAIGWRW